MAWTRHGGYYPNPKVVTKSDTTPDPSGPFEGGVQVTNAGDDGTLKVTFANGLVSEYTGLSAGAIIPIPVSMVWDNGSSADCIGLN